VVVADRFADSTFAYQGAGRGLDKEMLETLVRIAVGLVRPDLTFLLDVPPELGLSRVRLSAAETQEGSVEDPQLVAGPTSAEVWNRFEDEAHGFHKRVRRAYHDMAHAEPSRWVVIDSTRSVPEVASEIWSVVQERLVASDPV
jgi:dTMP kinase